MKRFSPVLLVLVVAPPLGLASGQPLAPGPPESAPEVRARLSQAAEDTLLPHWQRDFMLRLVRGGGPSRLAPRSSSLRAALPGQASAIDGWAESIVATSPSARGGHGAIYDPVRNRVVVFGGRGDLAWFNDVATLALAGRPAWTAQTPTGTPPSARAYDSAIYDPVRDRMVVFGGADYSYPFRNDVWALSLAGTPAWTALTPTGTPPGARAWHSAIYDPVHDRMVVFGGTDELSPFNDVWALSLAGAPAWSALTPAGTQPSPRYLHSAIYDPVNERMVVFGGLGGILYNDIRGLSLGGALAWADLTPTGSVPSPREEHSASYDLAGHRLVVFAGVGGSGYLNDVWTLGWSTTAAVGDPATQTRVSCLRPPAPDPFRGTTTVSYSIAQAGPVQLGVYDVGGRRVRSLVDGERSAGTETLVWDGTSESGSELGAGVYFVRLTGPGVRQTRRVVRLR